MIHIVGKKEKSTILFFVSICFLIFSGLQVASASIVVSPPQDMTISATVGADVGTTVTDLTTPSCTHCSSGYHLFTAVYFSGIASPFSKISFLKNGRLTLTTTADSTGFFDMSLNNLSVGTYSFTVYSEDLQSRRSTPVPVTFLVSQNVLITINNIFLSPTLSLDKTILRRGGTLGISGSNAPLHTIVLSLQGGTSQVFNVTSSNTGQYQYFLKTTSLAAGTYTITARDVNNTQINSLSVPVSFSIIDDEKTITTYCPSFFHGDLNCDTRVNLIDFSILSYWYKRKNLPPGIDLNSDNKITLVDFSIMASYWTD